MRHRRAVVALIITVALTGGTARATNVPHDIIVSDDPVDWTPHVLDGKVKSIVQIGSRVVVGGSFSRVQQPGGPEVERANIFAFEVTTGALDAGFAPNVDGVVEALAAAPDGRAVFVGGAFTTVNGTEQKRLAKLNLITGQADPLFDVTITSGASVEDLVVRGNRLFMGGAFSVVNGVARGRLAAVDAVTGAVDPSLDLPLSEKHNGGTLRVEKMDVTPDGSRLVIIGNFRAVAGQDRGQIAVIDLTLPTATLANWDTDRYEARCAPKFDTYLRDVDVSPDGSYFTVVTTGAYSGGSARGVLCDTAARWETFAVGAGLQPTWVDYSGGDSFTSVADTGRAIYVGGHQRWMNNPFGKNKVGAGAVPRSGIAALDPINGLPYSWNPGRIRGDGAYGLISTPEGLWIGSDTTFFSGEYHARLAFVPVAGGAGVPRALPGRVPGDLYTMPKTQGPDWESVEFLERGAFDGNMPGPRAALQTPGVDWSLARGGFLLSGKLYTGWFDGQMYVRAFDGRRVGPPLQINLNGLTAAQFPLDSVTGMFFYNGRLYYTLANNPSLYFRYFTPESNVIGAETFVASGDGDGLSWFGVNGMTMASGHMYFALEDGNLYEIDFSSGRPVPGTVSIISGPGLGDGSSWVSGGMFMASWK